MRRPYDDADTDGRPTRAAAAVAGSDRRVVQIGGDTCLHQLRATTAGPVWQRGYYEHHVGGIVTIV